MFNSDSIASKNSGDEKKKKKAVLNPDELGVDDDEIKEFEKQFEPVPVAEEEPPKPRLDSNDMSIEMLNQHRTEFLRKYSKLKYLLVFDKSITTSEVGYFMVNPVDNCGLLSKSFKFNLSFLRDLIFYRAVNIDNKIYFIGGISTKSRKISAQTFVYDTQHNSWKECDSLNTPRCKFSVTVVKNKIYVLGGQDIYGSPYDTIEKYDPDLDEWNDLGLLSKPLKFHASVATKNRYVIATGGNKNTEKNFCIYDTEQQDWRNGLLTMDLPIDRENHAMVAHHGVVYLLGGIRYEAHANDPDNPEPVNENTINSINLNSYKSVTNRVWKTLSHPKTKMNRNGCSAVVLGNYIYVVGGHRVANNDNEHALESKSVERFDPKTNKTEIMFNIEPDFHCMDVDCCLVDVDVTQNENFSIDSIFYANTPLW